MKKVLFVAFAIALSASWPTNAQAAANDCGCAATDVTCINNCTLSKVTTLRQNIQTKKEEVATKLANKEFQIMEMLMTNPGQVISTERFLEKIWGYDTDAEVNVVWVYISTLRKKLASLGTSVQIKAARGVGYSLEDKA